MFETILFVLWFFLPAGLANTTPVIVSKLPLLKNWNSPLDFKKSIGGIRIFGDHKTIRGFVFGVLAAIIVLTLQRLLYLSSPGLRDLLPINYAELNPFLLGFLLGFGSLAGDAIKSFFKRRVNVKPGDSWFPFDQTDYILGGIIFSYPLIQLTLGSYIVLFLIWFLLHPISTIVGYFLKLKDKPI